MNTSTHNIRNIVYEFGSRTYESTKKITVYMCVMLARICQQHA